MSLLELQGVRRDFDVSRPWLNRLIEGEARRSLRAVDDVSFTVQQGETLALVGESGSGKSTLARLIVGLYRPSAGRVEFRGRRMQMIFQDPYASLNPRWRVKSIVAEPLLHLIKEKSSRVRERVDQLLVQVGLSADDGEKYPHEFSGGQRQRISIARALAGEPDLLVCDEPTSALDVSVQAQILNLLKQLQRELGVSYLFITHNIGVVEYIADRVAVMNRGRIEETGLAGAVLEHPRTEYTRTLLAAVPRIHR